MLFLIILFGIVVCFWATIILLLLKSQLRNADILPLGCMAVIVCGSVFGHPFFNVSLGPLPLTLDRLLWGLLIFTCVVLVAYRWTTLARLDRLDLLVYGLLAVIAVSAISHDWQYKQQLPLRRLIFLNLMPVGIYWVARQANFNARQLKICLSILIVLGLYLSITGIFEWRGWSFAVFPRYISSEHFEEFLGRARGPFLNPVVNGIYICVCMAALTLMWSQTGRTGKWAVAILLPVFLLGAYATLTRSIWITAVSALFLTVWIPSPRAWKGVMVCGGAAALILVVALFSSKFNSFKRDKYVSEAQMSESVSLRPMLAYVAFKMARDKPMFGHGFGQYTAAKKPYHYNDTNQMELRKILPYMQHNVFLSYLTETGLVGCLLLILLLFVCCAKAWKLWTTFGPGLIYRQIGLLFLVAAAAYVLNGMFHDVSIIPMCGTLMMFLIGLLANISTRADNNQLNAGAETRSKSQTDFTKQPHTLAA